MVIQSDLMVIQWWFNGDSMGFNGIYDGIASGEHTKNYWSHGPVEIVDVPIKKLWIFP